ncbi:leucine-rich repeats and immunoglobulin-like domains protein 2 [Oenanthe melanoleuca]|uniref:leucine-rich repeats and immunoglobulin-like domains protein 2 n=1 Tax=Oenanthe melanoleuca TaxID=2939378 RepID=UPI0024C1BAEC|nr:leucine-rich repeats and immunoglobulin-like domains protein 2 [Oenanthe melanoleuca]
MFPVPLLSFLSLLSLLSFLSLLLLLLAPGSAAVAAGVTGECQPARPSPVSCSALLPAPSRGAREHRRGSEQGLILSHGPPSESRPSGALRVRLCRLRGRRAAAARLQLSVLEPLSQPRIVGSRVVKAGSSARLVCSVLRGQADSYWWKKNGAVLRGSERLRLLGNRTLCILHATISDSGYYTCVVSNAVSQNETSFLLQVHHSANVVLPMVLACVIIGVLAGIFVWCRRRKNSSGDSR